MESVSDRFRRQDDRPNMGRNAWWRIPHMCDQLPVDQIPFCLAGSKTLHHTQTPATQKPAAGVSLGESRMRSPHYHLKMFIFWHRRPAIAKASTVGQLPAFNMTQCLLALDSGMNSAANPNQKTPYSLNIHHFLIDGPQSLCRAGFNRLPAFWICTIERSIRYWRASHAITVVHACPPILVFSAHNLVPLSILQGFWGNDLHRPRHSCLDFPPIFHVS